MIVGAHVSIAGSLTHAFDNAREIGADAIQIFVKPPRRLRGIKPFTQEQIAAWDAARQASPVRAIVVHANYLINLAGEGHTGEYSREALLDEMKRAHELGIGTLIFHPGQHLGAGADAGLKTIAKSLQWCLKQGKDYDDVALAVENMAGHGTWVGDRFEHLEVLLGLVDAGDRFGVCLDTCHTFAAGYELRTPEAYAKTMEQLDATVGLANVKAFHLNDSKQDLGSHVDRHEAIGKGRLGDAAFKLLLQDARFRDAPGVVETPQEDNKGFKKDVARLRKDAEEPWSPKDLPKGQRPLL
jgi:deoxyribonuclease-4